MVDTVQTDAAPSFEELGLPISQATVHGETVYVAGQVGLDPETGQKVAGGVEAETRQALENVAAVLAAAGTDLDNLVKTTVFVEDMDRFEAVNDAYAEYVSAPFPARSAVEVSDLAGEFTVEIEAVAAL